MQTKRIIEVCFLAVFVLGVGLSLLVHQSYDEWLTRLVQASGSRVGGGPLFINNLKWHSADQKLSLSEASWLDNARSQQPWLKLPASQWQIPQGAWQGAKLHLARFDLDGLQVHIQQEGLTTNINRLIERVKSVTIEPEKVARGNEPLSFTVEQVLLRNIQVELATLNHGALRWTIAELTLDQSGAPSQAFDVLLQQVTLNLLQHLKEHSTQQLLTLPPKASPSAAELPRTYNP